ncbi:uncharacterized protein LOC113320044 isoform X2 [Papaver somniferum]|nr:uncharacterized protein LOC113320044 isoform X2 [Papaver somniferum]
MEEKKMQQLPPDEERCCHTSGANGIKYRCKNFRMGFGAAADDDTVPKTKRCEKHYYYFSKYFKNLKEKKTSGDHGEGAGPGPGLDMERKKQQQQLPPDEERCSKTSGTGKYKYRCKNFRMGYGASAAAEDYAPKTTRCEKHYNYFTDYFKNLKKKNKTSGDGEETRGSRRRRKKVMEEEDDLSLDDTCDSDTSAGGSSANFMINRKDVDQTQESGELKSLRGIREPVVETRAAKRRKMMVAEGDRFVDETSNQPATNDNCDSDTIIDGGSSDNERKRKYAERMSGELESLAGSVVELESLEHYKTKCIELSVELEKKKMELEKKALELENMNADLEKKKVECTKLQGKLADVEETRKTAATDETERTPADATECLSYLQSQVHRKENENSTKAECVEDRISNLESQVLRIESENSRKAACVESRISKLESQLLRMENKNSTTAGCVVSRISNLESLVPRMENGNSTMAGCGDSRISNLESLVFRSGKSSSTLRCVELRNSERVESEVPGLQNVITQSCEKPTDESNSSKLNAETSSGGWKDSHKYDIGANELHDRESEFPKYSAMNISSTTLHLSSEGQNVEEGKGWGSSSKRSSQHGSSSQDHLEMSAEPFANLVSYDGGESFSESEDSYSSGDSETSLGSLMDMLAMKYRDKNDNKEMK